MRYSIVVPGVLLLSASVLMSGSKPAMADSNEVFQANGIKIGEVTQANAIVWTRLTASPELNANGIQWENIRKPNGKSPVPDGKTLADMEAAVPGARGSIQLVHWAADSEASKLESEWIEVDADTDFTHQFTLSGLTANTAYQLEVRSRITAGVAGQIVKGSFRTAPLADQQRNVTFMVVTGQDYPRRDDVANGHRIYPHMQQLQPDFFVHTGDIEYYDKPKPLATNVALARFKWNRLYALPFERAFHKVTASYFIKDDHDTLKNDCWPGQTYGDLTWEQGLAIFKEQVPMGERTYRTVRWGKDLQVWLVEGRDFRSPNNMLDGPEKTIWGEEQKQWFFETVKASDATFKILISPTPLVGPDRDNKGDNHSNKRFAYEGKQLRDFIGKQKNMFVCCGDRHWQYVSVDTESGVREYSCGPTSDKHASGWSNDRRSPMHKYLNVVGGFLAVTISAESQAKPVAVFRHYSTAGKVLNEDRRTAE